MKKPALIEGEVYHIFNRGVEKRRIFKEKSDYERFLFSLEHFNTTNRVGHTLQTLNSPLVEVKPRLEGGAEKLVDILAFALMPNHFHVVLQQMASEGISRFMQKVMTGYTMYFNKKYERSGVLFQGTYKAVLMERDAQFMYIPHYVHKNPIDLAPQDAKKAERAQFLLEYPWSSYRDYVSEHKIFSFLHKEYFLESFGGDPKKYQKDFEGFIKKDGSWAVEKLKL